MRPSTAAALGVIGALAGLTVLHTAQSQAAVRQALALVDLETARLRATVEAGEELRRAGIIPIVRSHDDRPSRA